MNYIYRFSSLRAVNTVHHDYKNQSVNAVYAYNIFYFPEIHINDANALYKHNIDF